MNPRLLHGSVCLALVLATSIGFARVLGNDFVNIDDPHYVTGNELGPQIVRSGLNGPSVQWAWTTWHAGFWMPLTWMSLELDATLYWPHGFMDSNSAASQAAWGFHLTNLLLHLVNTLLAYRLMWKLTGSVGCAALIAGLFGVHPLRVESVAWVTERKDMLSCCVGLLALLAYEKYREKPGIVRMIAICLFFELSLLAKPALVTLPALMLLLDCWRRPAGVGWTRLVLEKVPLFALSLICTVITIQAQRSVGATALVEVSFLHRLGNALVSYQSYLAKAFWPVNLAVFYPHPGNALTGAEIGVAAATLIGITILATLLRKKVPAMLVGWLWFLGTLTPNIGLIQAGAQGMADRFTYFPLLGLFLAVAAGADYAARRLQVSVLPRFVLAAAILVSLGVLTWAQVGLWQNSETLYLHALAVTPDNRYVQELLGTYYYDQGDWDKAEEQFAPWAAAGDANANVCLYYGCILHKKKLWREAAASLEKSVAQQPELAISQYFLGDSLWHLADGNRKLLESAATHLAKALTLRPGFTEAYFTLAQVQRSLGDGALAEQTIRHALSLPASPELRARMEAFLHGSP